MENVQLSDQLSLSRVVVGCMRLANGGLKGESLRNFVIRCMDLGIDAFDHAPVYGNQTCDQLFGDAIIRPNPAMRKKIKIITKTGITLPGWHGNKRIFYDSHKETITSEVEGSLKRLGTDYIDLLLLHRPDPLADPSETAEALDELIKSGKVLNVGVSNYSASQFSALQHFLNAPLVTNQIEISVKKPDCFFDGTSDYLFEHGIMPMAWSPLGGGSLFAESDEQSVRLRESIGNLAEKHGTTMDSIMYAWLFRHPLRIMAVTGSTKIERIRKAVDALNIVMSYDEWYSILQASRGFDVP